MSIPAAQLLSVHLQSRGLTAHLFAIRDCRSSDLPASRAGKVAIAREKSGCVAMLTVAEPVDTSRAIAQQKTFGRTV